MGAAGFERPVAVAADGRAFDLRPLTSAIDGEFLADDGIALARAAVTRGFLPEIRVGGQRVGAPVLPGKVVRVGLDSHGPAGEPARIPAVFLKAPNTVVGPEDEISLPRGSVRTEHEVELAVVVGAHARRLPSIDAAKQAIAGYTISHDVAVRESLPECSATWDPGKSGETVNPLGPWLVPADEIDPAALELWLTVNGERRQRGSTAGTAFDPAYVVWHLSQYLTLEPGDVITTSPLAGLDPALPDRRSLRAGDVVEIGIRGLGSQRQRMCHA